MRKAFFWLIAAMMSVYSAEVISGSFPFPFFHAWGWGVLMPIYGLHLVVLAAIVFRWGKPRLRTLYAAGMLFGLYEAYITKILWTPRWFGAFSVAHIGVAEFLVLVLWWHPFMSFIVPLIASERLLIGSRTITISRRLRGVLIFGAVFECVVFGSLANSVPVTVLSLLAGGAVITALVACWRWAGWHRGATLESLMPGPHTLVLLTMALVALYIILTPVTSPEHLPSLRNQWSIGVVYVVTVLWFIRSLRKK